VCDIVLYFIVFYCTVLHSWQINFMISDFYVDDLNKDCHVKT